MCIELVIEWGAFVVTVIGAVCDWRIHKIPNRLTFTAIAVGFLLNLTLGGLSGLADSVLGILMGFTFFLLFALGALKAGDVKLYMAVGALSGWRFCGKVMIFSVIIGGVVSLGILITNKNGRVSLKRIWIYLVNMFLARKFYMYEPESEASYFCFGGCIAAGAAAAILRTVI